MSWASTGANAIPLGVRGGSTRRAQVYVADDTGLLKELDYGVEDPMAERPKLQKWRSQNRENQISLMEFGRDSGAEGIELLLGFKNGSVESFYPTTGATEIIRPKDDATAPSPVVGLYGTDDVVMTAKGTGQVWIKSRHGDGAETEVNASPAANVMRVCRDTPNIFGIGGKDTDPRIWDVNGLEAPVFKAKNLKPDMLMLQIPKCINDLAFVPGHGGALFVTGTAFREVRFYDSRAQNRPIYSIEVGEHAVNSLAIAPGGNTIIAGDVVGDIFSLELRTGRKVGKYKGFTGSCRDIQVHPTLPLVAACGIDRHVRVYDTNTHKCVFKSYLKQRLTCLAFRGGGLDAAAAPRGGGDGDGDGVARPVGDSSDDDELELEEEPAPGADDDLWAVLDDGAAKPKKKLAPAVPDTVVVEDSALLRKRSGSAKKSGKKKGKKAKKAATAE